MCLELIIPDMQGACSIIGVLLRIVQTGLRQEIRFWKPAPNISTGSAEAYELAYLIVIFATVRCR